MNNSHSNILALSKQEMATFTSQVDHMATVIGEGFEALEPKAVQRLLKLHAKRQAVVPDIVRLAGQYGVDSKSMPIATLNEQVAAAAQLQPLVDHVNGLQKVLSDMLLTVHAAAWQSASANYRLLNAEAKNNVVLRNALAPIRVALTNKKKDVTSDAKEAGRATAANTAASAQTTTAATTAASNEATSQAASPNATHA